MNHYVVKSLKSSLGCLLLLQSTISLANISTDYLAKNFTGKNYSPVFRTCHLANNNGQDTITQIRQFQMMNNGSLKNYALVVDDITLKTSVEPIDALLDCHQGDLSSDYLSYSNYKKALLNETSDEVDTPSNAGATHEVNTKQNIYLTVDLCPSHKPMDIDLFKKIQGGVKPVPVAISVSGLWLLKHGSDFKKLLDMQSSGDLSIIWVNHTFDHPYNPKLPNEHNFVLMPGVKLDDEVFENEKLLLKNGVIPSVFFRFPGLISDQEDVHLLRKWGLIPLGANAWLAKGETPQMGSFILVHGNGNEPAGIKILADILRQFPEMKKTFSDINEAFQY